MLNIQLNADESVTVRLPGKVELSGDKDRVIAALYDLGHEETARILRASSGKSNTYNSSSRGLLLISSMNHEHVRRALNKKIRTWAASLSEGTLVGPEYFSRLQAGVCADDPEFLPLLRRYAEAIKDGEIDED